MTLEGVGIHAARTATHVEALEPLRQGVRHDHGSQSRSDDFQAGLGFFGITSSPAFVRAPESFGIAERFTRTLKEQLLSVRTFRTVEKLRVGLQAWLVTEHEQGLVEQHGFRSLVQVRRELLAMPEAA